MHKTQFPLECCLGKVSPERVNFIENELGVRLPQEFIDIIKDCDGGVPIHSKFSFYNLILRKAAVTNIDRFLSLNDSPYSLLNEYKNPLPFFPKGLIPFAISETLNLICFAYSDNRKNPNPGIVYWTLDEFNGDRSVSFIASNFEEFIWKLKEFEDRDDLPNI